MTISEKISLVFFEILIVLVGIAGAIYYASAAWALQQGIDGTLRAVAAARGAAVETVVEAELERLRWMAALPAFRALLEADGTPGGRAAALDALREQRAAAGGDGPPCLGLALLDRSGAPVWAEPRSPRADGAAFARLFKEAASGAAVIPASSGTRRELLIAVPVVVREKGKFLGVLAAAFDARILDRAMGSPAGLGRTGKLVLLSGDGTVLAPVRHAGAAPAGGAPSSRGTSEPYAGTDGRRVIGASSPLRSLGWSMRAEMDVAEAYGPIYILRSVLIGLLVCIPALAALAGKRAARLIARPIEELLKGLRIVGKGDLDYTLDGRGPQETELLAAAFNDMVAQIRGARRLLDERVEERTRDLRQKTEELEQSRQALIYMLDDMNELNERLRELYAIKSDFTSMVSHELRTPLTAIKEGIALVLDGTAGPLEPEQREFLGLAEKNVKRLARLINDVLDYAKLEAGKIAYLMEENDLREIVREVVDAQRPVARERKLSLSMSLPPSAARALCDRDRITQVLTNLVGNALKFTQRGGVSVGVEESDGAVTVRVTDTGEGIPAEEMGRLFKRFEQIPRNGKRAVGGTGLGLAISKGIVEGHGGEIRAESESGKGSVFSFTLPRRRPAEGAQAGGGGQ